jgi:hypothetical protein
MGDVVHGQCSVGEEKACPIIDRLQPWREGQKPQRLRGACP